MLRRVSIPRRRTDAASCRGNASAQIFRQRVPEATGWSRFTKGLTYYCSLAIWPGAERRSHETCLYYTFRDDHGAGCSLAGGGAARDARNASEIAGFCIAVLQVRIHLSPADSPSLTGTSTRRSRTPVFLAGVRAMGGARSAETGSGRRHGAYPRQRLCWTKFQYRWASDAVQRGRSSCRAKPVLTQPVKRSRAPFVARAR